MPTESKSAATTAGGLVVPSILAIQNGEPLASRLPRGASRLVVLRLYNNDLAVSWATTLLDVSLWHGLGKGCKSLPQVCSLGVVCMLSLIAPVFPLLHLPETVSALLVEDWPHDDLWSMCLLQGTLDRTLSNTPANRQIDETKLRNATVSHCQSSLAVLTVRCHRIASGCFPRSVHHLDRSHSDVSQRHEPMDTCRVWAIGWLANPPPTLLPRPRHHRPRHLIAQQEAPQPRHGKDQRKGSRVLPPDALSADSPSSESNLCGTACLQATPQARMIGYASDASRAFPAFGLGMAMEWLRLLARLLQVGLAICRLVSMLSHEWPFAHFERVQLSCSYHYSFVAEKIRIQCMKLPQRAEAC